MLKPLWFRDKTKKLLSICMIVKNEEKNLVRCLDSLLPLIMRQWCELLIVDTGSTDNTVKIARKYTNKVYEKQFIPWSFSDARNFCNSKARGKWILTFDADHMLPQQFVYDLENVILAENEEYRTVFFTVRNYVNEANTQYTEMLQPLLFTNEGKPLYEGCIHNKAKVTPPFYFASAIYIHHFGYKFREDKELEQSKKERSLPMLEREYEKDPSDMHNLTHLCKMYFVFHENEMCIKRSKEWIELMKKVEYHEGWFAYLEVFVNLVTVYLMQDDIDSALAVVPEAEKYSKRLFNMYSSIAYWLAEHEREDEAEMWFNKCLEIATTDGSPYESLITNWKIMVVPGILQWLAVNAFKKGDFKKAGFYINEGIRINENRVNLRWDIWNEERAQARLVKG